MKWISVEKRLPIDENERIAIYDNVMLCYTVICETCANHNAELKYGIGYQNDEGVWNLSEPLNDDILPEHHCDSIFVTHWAILPKLPTVRWEKK